MAVRDKAANPLLHLVLVAVFFLPVDKRIFIDPDLLTKRLCRKSTAQQLFNYRKYSSCKLRISFFAQI